MYKLIQTSIILYDKDISEKTKEIRKFKQIYNTPHIFFNNYNEWINRKQLLLNNIKQYLIEIINKEYTLMYFHGFTIKLKQKIYNLIFTELKNLTNNSPWSNNISNNIVIGIETFIISLKNTNIWDLLYLNITHSQLCILIYNNIEWYLCNTKYWPSILDKIPEFECKKCKKKDNFVNINNICINCS